MKTCVRCRQPLDESAFGVRPERHNAPRSKCRVCEAQAATERRAANPEKSREAGLRYHAKNRELCAERCRQWREENPEKVRDYTAQYAAQNGDYMRAYSRQYYYENLGQCQENSREWKVENADHVASYKLAYNRANPDKTRAWNRRRRVRANNGTGSHTAADEQAQLQRQRGLCYYCGDHVSAYHVDHVFPLSRGGSNDPSNIVIACAPCNLRKHTKLPHEFSGRLC